MKKLKKDKVYVLIDNQPDCDRAIEILTKAGEPMWKNSTAFMFTKDDNSLVIDTEGEWLIDRMIGNRTPVTLDDLERILMPKIKKSELLERIEKLESIVKDLENRKVTPTSKPIFRLTTIYV